MVKRRYCTIIILTEIPGPNSKGLKSLRSSAVGEDQATLTVNNLIKIKTEMKPYGLFLPQKGVGGLHT